MRCPQHGAAGTPTKLTTRPRQGQASTEFIVLLTLVGIALLVIVTLFGNDLKDLFLGAAKRTRGPSSQGEGPIGAVSTDDPGYAGDSGGDASGGDSKASASSRSAAKSSSPSSAAGTSGHASNGSSANAAGTSAGSGSSAAKTSDEGGSSGGGSGGSGSSHVSHVPTATDDEGGSFWSGPGALLLMLILVAGVVLVILGASSNLARFTN